MTKTEKKLDATIIRQLTLACEEAKPLTQGFEWLTHEVNFKKFPQSLSITCMFDSWENTTLQNNQEVLRDLCVKYLSQEKVKISSTQIQFSVDQ